MPDLLLRGGRPWRFDGPADVLLRDGVIARIEPGIAVEQAEVLDVSGQLLLPLRVDVSSPRPPRCESLDPCAPVFTGGAQWDSLRWSRRARETLTGSI